MVHYQFTICHIKYIAIIPPVDVGIAVVIIKVDAVDRISIVEAGEKPV